MQVYFVASDWARQQRFSVLGAYDGSATAGYQTAARTPLTTEQGSQYFEEAKASKYSVIARLLHYSRLRSSISPHCDELLPF